MFKISPIQDKDLQKKYAEDCNAEFCPDLFAYSMINQESGELMGMSQFDISGDSGYIKTLKPKDGYSDFEAMFILARQTMNFIEGCGAHICYADENTADHAFLKAVGFNDQLVCDMTGMFDGHCGCK